MHATSDGDVDVVHFVTEQTLVMMVDSDHGSQLYTYSKSAVRRPRRRHGRFSNYTSIEGGLKRGGGPHLAMLNEMTKRKPYILLPWLRRF